MGLDLRAEAELYFMGIGGTGMAAVAGLMQEAGYKVTGSDKGVYPSPLSFHLFCLLCPKLFNLFRCHCSSGYHLRC